MIRCKRGGPNTLNFIALALLVASLLSLLDLFMLDHFFLRLDFNLYE